jgi:hypothetical protein
MYAVQYPRVWFSRAARDKFLFCARLIIRLFDCDKNNIVGCAICFSRMYLIGIRSMGTVKITWEKLDCPIRAALALLPHLISRYLGYQPL